MALKKSRFEACRQEVSHLSWGRCCEIRIRKRWNVKEIGMLLRADEAKGGLK